jgi:Acyltransferase family
MKKNLQHIDQIRFLIIHLIIINHWMLTLALANVPYNHDALNFWFDQTSPTLAIISGYFFFYRSRENFPYLAKLKNRFHTLVVPYLIWSLSFFVIFIVIKDVYARIFHSTYWYSPEQALTFKTAFLNIIDPPLKNFWYLQSLVLILPFNFLIYYLLKNKYVFFTVLLAVLVIYTFNLADLWFQSRFLPYYLLGCYLGYNEQHIPKVPLSKTMTLILIPVTVGITVYTSYWAWMPALLPLRIIVTVLFLITVYNMLDSNQNSVMFRYLDRYKGYSFFLFAIHMFILNLVQRPLLRLGGGHYIRYDFGLGLFLITSLVAVLVITLYLAGFLKRRFSRFYFTITGR